MIPRLHSPSMSTLIRLGLFLLMIFPAWGHCQEVSLIMVTEQWPPYRIIDQSHPSGFRGIDIDIVHQLSNAIGIKIEIQRHPWARALEQMRNGQADMITGIAFTREREGYLYYVPVSYGAVRPVFYTRKGRGHLIQSYRDLYGPSVGYSLRSAYFEPFDSDSKINKVGFSTEEQLLHTLALGRIEVTIGTDPNISYDILRLGYKDALEPTKYQPAHKTPLYIALSRKSPVMKYSHEIGQALRRLKDNGTINKIINAYR